MNILISGSHGFIGSAVYQQLRDRGHRLQRLIRPRQAAHSDEVFWDYSNAYLNHARLEPVEAVIHLAGEPIADRWSEAKKAAIRESRVRSTAFLCASLAKLSPRPQVLLCASAVGFYGSRGEDVLDETAAAGEGFLAAVCRDWEAATDTAAAAGIRVVNLRFGMVLGTEGGALAAMRPVFKAGAGGPLGDGRQWVSWISRDDAAAAIVFALDQEALSGPVNLVAPQPVRNRQFAQTLGRQLHRPAVLAAPKPLLRLALGEFADEALLASTRAIPAKLSGAGFAFQHPDLQTALESFFAG